MSRAALRRNLPCVLVGLGYALVLYLVFAPGGMSVDSVVQWGDAANFQFSNWHPPTGALLFWVAQRLGAASPWPVLLLQGFALATAQFAIVRRVTGAHAAVVAGLCAIGLFAPPVLLQAHVMWKDTWSAVAFLWCVWAALVLTKGEKSRVATGTFILSGFLTAAFRHNGFILTAIMCVALGLWAFRARDRRLLVAASATFLLALVGPKFVERATNAVEMHPVVQILLHDLAGTEKCANFADWNELKIEKFVPREALDVGYTVNEVVPMFWDPVNKKRAVVEFGTIGSHESELRTAWWKAVKAHPGCYLEHRWNIFRRLNALDGGPVCYPFHPHIEKNPFGIESESVLPGVRALAMSVGTALGQTLLFRLSWYMLVGVALVVLFVVRRHYIIAVAVAAAVAYHLAYVFAVTTCDFRMGWVLVVMVWTCLPMAFIVAERTVDGQQGQM